MEERLAIFFFTGIFLFFILMILLFISLLKKPKKTLSSTIDLRRIKKQISE